VPGHSDERRDPDRHAETKSEAEDVAETEQEREPTTEPMIIKTARRIVADSRDELLPGAISRHRRPGCRV
jgi:hypothetical protein